MRPKGIKNAIKSMWTKFCPRKEAVKGLENTELLPGRSCPRHLSVKPSSKPTDEERVPPTVPGTTGLKNQAREISNGAECTEYSVEDTKHDVPPKSAACRQHLEPIARGCNSLAVTNPISFGTPTQDAAALQNTKFSQDISRLERGEKSVMKSVEFESRISDDQTRSLQAPLQSGLNANGSDSTSSSRSSHHWGNISQVASEASRDTSLTDTERWLYEAKLDQLRLEIAQLRGDRDTRVVLQQKCQTEKQLLESQLETERHGNATQQSKADKQHEAELQQFQEQLQSEQASKEEVSDQDSQTDEQLDVARLQLPAEIEELNENPESETVQITLRQDIEDALASSKEMRALVIDLVSHFNDVCAEFEIEVAPGTELYEHHEALDKRVMQLLEPSEEELLLRPKPRNVNPTLVSQQVDGGVPLDEYYDDDGNHHAASGQDQSGDPIPPMTAKEAPRCGPSLFELGVTKQEVDLQHAWLDQQEDGPGASKQMQSVLDDSEGLSDDTEERSTALVEPQLDCDGFLTQVSDPYGFMVATGLEPFIQEISIAKERISNTLNRGHCLVVLDFLS